MRSDGCRRSSAIPLRWPGSARWGIITGLMNAPDLARPPRAGRLHRLRLPAPRPVLAALAVVAVVASSSIAPAFAKAPPGRPVAVVKPQPTRTVPYRIGAEVTVDTDIASTSGVAAWAIDQYLKENTPLPPLGDAFLRAERDYGVNALVLVGIAMHESSYGTSPIAVLKKNLFGYNALDRDPMKYAATFASYAEGVDFVARYLRDEYLVPTGRFWTGYTTLRSVNLAYATDPGWQDGVVMHANRMRTAVPTLLSRHVRFALALATTSIQAGRPGTATVRWSAAPGATLPPLLQFAARWTPLSIVETATSAPGAPAEPAWAAVPRKVAARTVALQLAAPPQPGLWRLDLDIRDVDGQPLPALDHPTVGSAVVRVVGAGEALLAVTGGSDGTLVASIRAAGPRPVSAVADAVAGKAGPALEAWSIPLDAAQPAVRLATQPIDGKIDARTPLSMNVPLKAAHLPAIIVVRLAATGVTRAVPAVVFVARGTDGKLAVSHPIISDPRTVELLGHVGSDPAPVDVVETGVPGMLGTRVAADVVGGIASPLPTIGPDPTPTPTPVPTLIGGFDPNPPSPTPTPSATPEPTPIPMSGRYVVVRAIAAAGPADPATTRAEIPASASGTLQLPIDGFAPGVRLVVAWLEAADGGSPTALWLGWLDVAGPAS